MMNEKFDDNVQFDSVDVSHEHAHPHPHDHAHGHDHSAHSSGESPAVSKMMKYQPFILPGAILIAAILVSGTIFYSKFSSNSGTTKVKPQIEEIQLGAGDHVLGDPKAKVTVVEFADFRCPFCERFFQQAATPIIQQYVNTGKVRFIFKNYAFLGKESTWASQAVECAADQGKFWEYHDWLYSNQAPENNLAYYSKANLNKYAGKVSGINVSKFAQCLNTDQTAQRVADDLALGQRLGITGTPTTLIIVENDKEFDVAYIRSQQELNKYVITLPNGNSFIVGAQPFDAFKTILDEVLK